MVSDAAAPGGRPDEEIWIPHEVVTLHLEHGRSLIRAWREHLKLSPREVAGRMGISEPAYAKMEANNARPSVATLKIIAEAMSVEWEQPSAPPPPANRSTIRPRTMISRPCRHDADAVVWAVDKKADK
ncbi:helix-turn-helix domain-containing protein [Desulfovibrio sp. TomC]|uniref:helix-turn-helix domain-containing protein n=1 Tax=Desulfovibrio sp. TomC TaxID=1562888 RepID=UPI0009E4A525|nr:helix-turn-helix transcriptional regulator [Desulfovibrio sp. TomC]